MSSTPADAGAAPKKATRDFRPVRSSGPMASTSGAAASSSTKTKKSKKEKRVYSFEDLMSYKAANTVLAEGVKLPTMEIVSSGGDDGGRRGRDDSGGGGSWSRGQVQPAQQREERRGRGESSGGGQWNRAAAPAPGAREQRNDYNDRGGGGGRNYNDRNDRGGGGGRNLNDRNDRYDDGPQRGGSSSAPLGPVVNNTGLKIWKKPAVGGLKQQVKKKVFGILNKMTKDRFAKLSQELCAQPIETMDILRTVIMLVFDKALMEPAFGDMYSDLCLKLQQKLPTNSFVRTVKDYDTDEYYWTADNDVNEELAGPYLSFEEVRVAARENVDGVKPEKRPEGVSFSIEDYLVEKKNSVKIFVGDDNKYYAVAKRVPADSQSIGLFGPFPDKASAEDKAKKMNSFKRMLLNQCQVEYEKEGEVTKFDEKIEEFKKQKDTMDPKEFANGLEDLTFDRLKVKRRCLGNISFIGQLYVKKMLQVPTSSRILSHLPRSHSRPCHPSRLSNLPQLLITCLFHPCRFFC